MENKKDNMLEVTSYEVLGKLPDLFQMEDGSRLTDPADWEKRRAELYKTAVELQYGTMPPKPEFLEVETLYLSPNSSSYRIITGRRENFKLGDKLAILDIKPFGKITVIVGGETLE